MKGIILAGGTGTRLFPTTSCVSKQLLPVYDKPTIYYPLSVLMLAGIREILIISTPRDIPLIESLLNDGSHLGLRLSYQTQDNPEGIAHAFIIAEHFINKSPVCLILGDNIFFGHNVPKQLEEASKTKEGAVVFGYHVPDPQRYGVVEFDSNQKIISIEEKPVKPKSNFAITGLYFYDHKVVEIAKTIKKSPRGELEITDINKFYLTNKQLHLQIFGRGVAWLDTGTHDSLLESSQFVQTVEKRQGLKIACLEEIALYKNLITRKQLLELCKDYPDSSYGSYVKKIAKGEML